MFPFLYQKGNQFIILFFKPKMMKKKWVNRIYLDIKITRKATPAQQVQSHH